MATGTATKKRRAHTEYPVGADEYFKSKSVSILGLPITISSEGETRNIETSITSAYQFITYIEDEIVFWEEHDPQGVLTEYTVVNKLKQAKECFKNAVNAYESNPASPSGGHRHMDQGVGYLSNGHLHSKTKLAKALLKNLGRGKGFLSGFMQALLTNRRTNVAATVENLEGFVAGLEYRRVVKQLVTAAEEDYNTFEANVQAANQHFADLNASYMTAFHEQEQRIAELTRQTDDKFKALGDESEKYFAAKELRCSELEALYEEKLKLQAPAQYWKDLEKEYRKKGSWWMVASVAFAIIMVAALIDVLIKMPNLFSAAEHWFDVVRIYAILTVIASVAIYVLRLFVKLTVSSIHLSRDAKERNNLTCFYLALIEKKGVSEKDRAIVLNSLFSRADTGLLKGDSTPVMSGNVTDLVNAIGKQGS